MRNQDKRNLIRSWPVYLLFLTLMVVMLAFYNRNQARLQNETLARSVQKSFYGVSEDRQFRTIDEVINDRKSWHPLLPDWRQKPIEDFAFTTPANQTRRLSDFSGRPTVVLVWATWYPACKMQLTHLRESLALAEVPVTVLALTAENPAVLNDFPADDYPGVTFGSVSRLDEPLSLPGSIPAVFFLDPGHRLILAAEGLITVPHILAILDLSEPQSPPLSLRKHLNCSQNPLYSLGLEIDYGDDYGIYEDAGPRKRLRLCRLFPPAG